MRSLRASPCIRVCKRTIVEVQEVSLLWNDWIPQDRWAEVWKFLISIGPITRIASAPIYEISPQHLEALCHTGLPFELVNPQTAEPRAANAESR